MNRACIYFEQNIKLHSSGTLTETSWDLAHQDHEWREALYKSLLYATTHSNFWLLELAYLTLLPLEPK